MIGMQKWRQPWLLALLVVMLSACGNSGGGGSGGGGNQGNLTEAIFTQLSGRVLLAANTDSAAGVAAGASVQVMAADNKTILATAIADEKGVVNIAKVVADRDVLLRIQSQNSVPQVLPLHLNKATQQGFETTLLPVGKVVSMAQFELGGTASGPDGAQVLVEPASFVDSDGRAVVGTVDVAITPYNPSLQPQAFPGTPLYRAANGEWEYMASAGMTNFTFTQNGQTLQLAAGKTAKVHLPLYGLYGPDGQLLAEGTTVPAWSMDDASGTWKQEGNGIVVRDASSPTGFAMEATVAHFSWWNTDFAVLTRELNFHITNAQGQAYLSPLTVQAEFRQALPNFGTKAYGLVSVRVAQISGDGDTLPMALGFDTELVLSYPNGEVAAIKSISATELAALIRAGASIDIQLGPVVPGLKVFPSDSVVLAEGGEQSFVARSIGLPDDSVTWLVNGIVGGNASVGTISNAGVYTAPAAVADEGVTVTVTARSSSQPTVQTNVSVAVIARFYVRMNGQLATGGQGGLVFTAVRGDTPQFSASRDPEGLQPLAMRWKVVGVLPQGDAIRPPDWLQSILAPTIDTSSGRLNPVPDVDTAYWNGFYDFNTTTGNSTANSATYVISAEVLGRPGLVGQQAYFVVGPNPNYAAMTMLFLQTGFRFDGNNILPNIIVPPGVTVTWRGRCFEGQLWGALCATQPATDPVTGRMLIPTWPSFFVLEAKVVTADNQISRYAFQVPGRDLPPSF
ncbi:FAM171 family protein [Neisseriaceae bacterium TC5R-5]|nr:FAM171 family protein [Neisseriaceae bacterium TC5R-5]